MSSTLGLGSPSISDAVAYKAYAIVKIENDFNHQRGEVLEMVLSELRDDRKRLSSVFGEVTPYKLGQGLPGEVISRIIHELPMPNQGDTVYKAPL